MYTRKAVKAAILALSVLLIGILSSSLAHAGHPLVTDDAYTQGKGHFQFEFGAEYARASFEGVKDEAYLVPVLPAVSYGLIDNIDLVATPAYIYTKSTFEGESQRGKANEMVLQAKWRFFESGGLNMALKPGVLLPLVSDTSGTFADNMAYSLYFIASYEVNAFNFHLNSGYDTFGDNGHFTNLWHNSLAMEYNIFGPVKLVANTGFDMDEENKNDMPFFGLLGMCYSPTENLDFDLGFKRLFNTEGTDYAVLAGITFRI